MAVLEQGTWYPNKEVNELSYEDSFELPQTAEQDRYHLYMSLACPFAHRPYLVINFLGLNDAITVSSVADKRYDDGWLFDDVHSDPLYNAGDLVKLYQRAKPGHD
ncbi:hypothetical protein BIT28_09490 [Photobacterium proteolyticum]|uniref:GST N-terminal domain-containing protein n=1 Tax=Photobacterium proteolyticum TaxID=1903952 RepID=A0A1Q9H1K1_9GAMM|nr:hypothetical protein [Photobacterium proteolyticum]OLQ81596.1 hypothetical protein BIT28_09490 [Photobacterium proteolyticum]